MNSKVDEVEQMEHLRYQLSFLRDFPVAVPLRESVSTTALVYLGRFMLAWDCGASRSWGSHTIHHLHCCGDSK